jgi:hypothetical protein
MVAKESGVDRLGSAGVRVLNGNLFRNGSSKYEIYRTKDRVVGKIEKDPNSKLPLFTGR